MDEQIKKIPYWTDVSTAPRTFPWLDHHTSCDVAIIGSGIAGTLCALRFAEAGVKTVLCGDLPVGTGSTGASPGVISYQTEGGINSLSEKIGAQQANTVYGLCAEAVLELMDLCGQFGEDVGLRPAECLYYTTSDRARQKIFQEYLTRSHGGFDVEYLENESAEDKFSFPIAGGVLSKGLAAEVNPYLLACAAARRAQELGAQIFENTRIVSVDDAPSGVMLHTSLGKTVQAKRVIMAAGSESAKQLGLFADVRTAFNLVTAPLPDFPGWYARALLASDGMPDIRLRTTQDNRIIISGLSSGLSVFSRLPMPVEALKRKKYQELQDILCSMFPGLPDPEVEYAFSCDYIRTSDALPVVGMTEESSSILFCLCTGENGITFAALASKMLLELYGGSPPPELALFSPER